MRVYSDIYLPVYTVVEVDPVENSAFITHFPWVGGGFLWLSINLVSVYLCYITDSVCTHVHVHVCVWGDPVVSPSSMIYYN